MSSTNTAWTSFCRAGSVSQRVKNSADCCTGSSTVTLPAEKQHHKHRVQQLVSVKGVGHPAGEDLRLRTVQLLLKLWKRERIAEVARQMPDSEEYV